MALDSLLAEKIRKAGFSEKEALIYTHLLSSGGAYPSKIAIETKLNRTTVYKVLEILAVRGLVTELEKKNKLFYQAEKPVNLERYARSRVTKAKRELEGVQKVIPLIEGLYSNSPNKPIVRFFEGGEGVLAVYQDHVDVAEGYEMLAFSNTSDLMHFLTEDFRDSYISKKAKLGITTRAVLPDTEFDLKYKDEIYGKFPKKIWPQFKHIPKTTFTFKSDLTIYGKNKVSIINFNEPQLAAIIVEDQIIHDMMTMIFELAWRGAG